jgi:hypothetical protein
VGAILHQEANAIALENSSLGHAGQRHLDPESCTSPNFYTRFFWSSRLIQIRSVMLRCATAGGFVTNQRSTGTLSACKWEFNRGCRRRVWLSGPPVITGKRHMLEWGGLIGCGGPLRLRCCLRRWCLLERDISKAELGR